MRPTIHPDVRSVFLAFSIPLEGCIAWMYCDILRLVTIAIGCLLTSVEQAVRLPFVERLSRRPASEGQIRADWAAVQKNAGRLAKEGAAAAEGVTQLDLTRDGIEQLVWARAEAMIGHLTRQFPAFPDWPPSAQLAVLSLAWAVGSTLRPTVDRSAWPKLAAALDAQDWLASGDEIAINPRLGTPRANPGVVPRNWANQQLLWSLALAQQIGAPLDVLHGYATSYRAPAVRPDLSAPEPWADDARRASDLAAATTAASVGESITDAWRKGR